jgi:hypothetical protein
VHPNVGVPNAARDLWLRARRRGKRDLRVASRYLWRGSADECVGDRVVAGIAPLQNSCPVLIRNGRSVVVMRRQPVVVLWMVVIVVHVGVQRRHDTPRREERRDEQPHQ